MRKPGRRGGAERSCHGGSSGDQNATLRERAKITFEGPRALPSLRLDPQPARRRPFSAFPFCLSSIYSPFSLTSPQPCSQISPKI